MNSGLSMSSKRLTFFLLVFVIISTVFGYRTWIQEEKGHKANYGMYISNQYNILSLMRNSLAAKGEKQSFINNLELLKGEYIAGSYIFNHEKFPEQLYYFNKRGMDLTDRILKDELEGRSTVNDISELEKYEKQLTKVVRQLNYSKVIEGNRTTEIYEKLSVIGKSIKNN